MAQFFHLSHAPIRLNSRHEWLHGETLMDERVAALFSRSIEACSDGQYLVRVGQDTERVHVDDTAFCVLSAVLDVEPSPEGPRLAGVKLHISDGHWEPLDGRTLMQSADNVLYCRIQRQGYEVPCRIRPHQYHAMALYVSFVGGHFCMEIGGKNYALGAYDRRPTQVHGWASHL